MSILSVTKMGNPILRLKVKEVPIDEINSSAIQTLIKDMCETMREEEGVGIAAPQVSQSLSIMLMEIRDNTRYENATLMPLQVFINPTIIFYSKEYNSDWEGCLSVDNMRAKVKRSNKIVVTYYDENAQFHQSEFEDFYARVVQHEYDHLEGILYVDKVTDYHTFTHLDEFEKYYVI